MGSLYYSTTAWLKLLAILKPWLYQTTVYLQTNNQLMPRMRYLMSSVHFCTISTGIVCTISLLPRSAITRPFFAGINHVKPTVLMQLLCSCWFRGVLLLAIKPAGVQKLSKRSTSLPDFGKRNVPKQSVMTWIVLFFFFRVKLILSLHSPGLSLNTDHTKIHKIQN